ncbi:MAG: hypothetical protein KDA89_02810 [Planctomycetaceae bacterium]|nr:hypothetical protein [Planctomycetaceae bacterium]
MRRCTCDFESLCFGVMLTLILSVSAYDTMLIVQYRDWIGHLEENPIGRWLISLDSGNINLFVRSKLAGTLVVAVTLITLKRRRSTKTMPVTTSLAAYQTGLLTYLTLA